MESKKFLTRDDILGVNDLPYEDVLIPEWGNRYVRVRTLTGAERDAFEQSIIEQRGKKVRMKLNNIRARLVALTVIDENGNRVFSDEDAEWLGKKSAAALDRIYTVAQRLNGFRKEDIEELEGNSDDAQSDDFILG